MKRVGWGITVLLLLLVAVEAAAQATASEQLARLFEDEWEFGLVENPLFATSVGDRRFNDRLPSLAVGDIERRAGMEREFLRRVQSIDWEALSPGERISAAIFERLKRDEIQEYTYRTYLTPITNREGFHVFFPQLPGRVRLQTVEDYENYIARLNGFEKYAEQHIELMRIGLREGFTLPKLVLEDYQGAIEPHIVDDPGASLLYGPFRSFPDGIAETDRERLTAEGVKAISESVIPGYQAFLAFMNDEYYPGARETIAASDLPNGQAFYEYRVRRFTTLDLTPLEVHSIGLAEVQRIRGKMQEIIERVEFDGSFAQFIEFLRTDERFYVDDPEELLRRTSLVLKRMDGQLPKLFNTLPRLPYGIRPIPDFIAPKTTTAYYSPGAGDGTRAGYYNVNLYNLPSRPLYEIEALSFHESVPGHHLQIALQQEIEDLPAFRRFSGFTAFVEGWALYAERLGLETGFYQDPYSDFGRLSYEMWRALRLVVDPGMHYLGWTRQQAIDFMAQNSALSLHNIVAEVDRYIAWPGQAVAYKMGELKIRELREYAESELGDRFDVREFHDVVLLSGAVPMGVLETNVSTWVAGKR
ncbi:MAG: DUF885 domain-containing protein [Planctomycetota bacterium]|jgi:uncharacterized protein (DUF885 family)